MRRWGPTVFPRQPTNRPPFCNVMADKNFSTDDRIQMNRDFEAAKKKVKVA